MSNNRSVNKNQSNPETSPEPNILFSNEAIPSLSSSLYYVSVVGPSVLVGFFILLSIFNQNLKGLAYLVGICVLFTLTNTFNEMFSALSESKGSRKCYSHGLFSSRGGLSYGTLVYVFSFFYLLLPMMINGIVNIPLLFSLIMVTIVDGVVNIRHGCTTMTFIVISFLLAMIAGTFWSLIIYQIKPDLVYHTDYITNNKLACSMPSKQKFKCVVKKRGEIVS
tara:strand:- start:8207 stop:8872 length:666 start_codon:yes stop_codon:yes gene_type:complete